MDDDKSRALADENKRFPPLLVFPQGTTVRNDVVTQFQRGIFAQGLPVQPVALNYRGNRHFDPSYVCYRKNDWFFLRHFTQFSFNKPA